MESRPLIWTFRKSWLRPRVLAQRLPSYFDALKEFERSFFGTDGWPEPVGRNEPDGSTWRRTL